MVATDNGESGFDFGEGAYEMVTTSTEGCSRVVSQTR